MYALNDAATANVYPEAQNTAGTAAILECPGSVRLNIEVRSAATFYQLRLRTQAGMQGRALGWSPEVKCNRMLRSIDRRADAIRFRSAVAGSPATVNVEALEAADVA